MAEQQRTIGFLAALRLAGVPLSMTLVSLLIGGVTNRVMVVELGLPVTLAGFFLSAPQLIAFLRSWFGHLSDRYALGGRQREPYVLGGTLLAGMGAVMAIWAILAAPPLFSLGALLVVGGLVLHGVGRNLAGIAFQALVAEGFGGVARQRAVTAYEVTRILAFIAGAGLIGALLQPYSAPRFVMVVIVTAVSSVLVTGLAIWRQETPKAPVPQRQTAASAAYITLLQTVIWPDKQARRFFVLILLVLLGGQMQDVLLEPFAALRFGLTVGQTTQLTAFIGIGALVGMLATGFYLLRRWSSATVMASGLALAVLALGGLLVSSGIQSQGGLHAALIVFGLGVGLANATVQVLMTEFTPAGHAGLLLGIWTTAFLLGQAIAALLAGAAVDLLLWLLPGQTLLAYSLVFALEAFILLLPLLLIYRINIAASTLWTWQPSVWLAQENAQ